MDTEAKVVSKVRESTPADKESIFKLREAVYGEPFDEDAYHWKFEKHSGIPAKIYVADVDGAVVGLRSFIVERLKIHEKEWLAGLGVDIMVHPDFRRYGIASQVANEAFVDIERAGIPILVGFPNEDAFKVYTRRRSSWRHVCSVPLLVKPLNIDRILRNHVKNSLARALLKAPAQLLSSIFLGGKEHRARGFTLAKADGFDERFDALWEEARQQYDILLVRDRTFLQWRFQERPDADCVVFVAERDGKLLGYTVLREDRMFDLNLGFILDLFAVNPDVASALVSKAREYFKELGADAIGCMMLQHTPYFKVLRRAGFVIAPKRLIHKEFYFGVQVKPSEMPDEIINRRESWFITFADVDVV